MKKDMLSLETVLDDKGNVIGFTVTVTDVNFRPIYKGKISAKEYLNLTSGAYRCVVIESDR